MTRLLYRSRRRKMRRSSCTLLWSLILYSAGLAVYTTVHAQAAHVQCLHEIVRYFPMITGRLTLECRVPPDYRHHSAAWYVDGEPFFLPECQIVNKTASSEAITCEANITEGKDAVSMFKYYKLSEQQNCTFQCINNINLLPPSSSPSPTPTQSPSTIGSTLQLHSQDSPTTTPTSTPEPSDQPWVIVTVILTLGLALTLVLIVGGVLIGVIMWKRKAFLNSKTSNEEEKESILEEIDTDHGFLLGAEQQNLFKGEKSPADVKVSFSSIILHELIHNGTFKLVHRAKLKSTEIAVKRLKDPTLKSGKEELIHEINTMKELLKVAGNDIHLASLVGVTDGDPLCLMLEYVPHGTLQQFLRQLRVGPLPTWYTNHLKTTLVDHSTASGHYHRQVVEDLMSVLIQVAEAGKFLADNGFPHGDIATRNVLIGGNLLIKLANFGIQKGAQYFVETGRTGFLQNMAPETMEEMNYTSRSDVWSFGVLIYQTATLESREPYKNVVTATELYKRIESGERPQANSCYSNELHFLLQQCWQFDPNDRVTFTKLCGVLEIFSQNPSNHITLRVSTKRKGYVSSSGQVYLHPAPMSVYRQKLTSEIALSDVSLETQQDSSTNATPNDSGVDSLPRKHLPELPVSSLVTTSQRSSQVTASNISSPAHEVITQITKDDDGNYKLLRSTSATSQFKIQPLLH